MLDGINTDYSSTPIATTENNSTQNLGQDAFMQLLLAQMQNQDPLEPMSDTDFIAQLAQFNSLNELTSISATLDELLQAQALNQGSALIGKTVQGIGMDGQTLTGVVSGLQISGGNVVLNIDGYRMSMDDVQSVTATEGSSDNGGQS
jgi:flagellar basal-body rod modification protein FlgD